MKSKDTGKQQLTLHVNAKVEACTVIHPIVEVRDAPGGLYELKVRDSQGMRIGFFQIDSRCLDDDLKDALHDWQARHTGVATLSLS